MPVSREARAIAPVLLATACTPSSIPRPVPAATQLGMAGPTLTGIVRDDRSDAPIVDAWLLIFANTTTRARALAGVRTDAGGVYRFPALPMGRYMVRVQHAGFVTETRPVQLGDCGYATQATGGQTSYCTDRKNFYLTSTARFQGRALESWRAHLTIMRPDVSLHLTIADLWQYG